MSPAPGRTLLMAPAPASGGGGFNPATLDLIGWYDASDLASITSSGGLVSQWNDKGPAGRHTVETTNKPTTGTDSMNGLNAIKFDGTNDKLISTAGGNYNVPAAGVAFFVAMRHDAGSTYGVLGIANGGTFSPTSSRALYSNGGPEDLKTNLGAGAEISASSTPWVPSNPLPSTQGLWVKGVNIIANRAHFFAMKNGVLFTTDQAYTTVLSGTIPGIALGTANDGGRWLNGCIGEAIVCGGDFSASGAYLPVMNYLGNKWGANWNPGQLPGVIGWWDASDTSTITASGGAVSQWANKVSGGQHLVQGTGANQPLTGVNTILGKNVIKWVDSSDLLTAAITTPAPFTALVVFRHQTANNITGMVHGTASDYTIYTVSSSVYSKAAGSPQSYMAISNGVVYQTVFQCASGANSNGWMQRTQRFTNQDVGASAFTAFNVGMQYVGDIAEVVIMSGAISSTDRTKWDDYCTTKWGTP